MHFVWQIAAGEFSDHIYNFFIGGRCYVPFSCSASDGRICDGGPRDFLYFVLGLRTPCFGLSSFPENI